MPLTSNLRYKLNNADKTTIGDDKMTKLIRRTNGSDKMT